MTDFNNGLFLQWCQLYLRFVGADGQRLARIVNECAASTLNTYRTKPRRVDVALLLANATPNDADFLEAYGWLCVWEQHYAYKATPDLLYGYIEVRLPKDHSRYILAARAEHPIMKAIPSKHRFKLKEELGTTKVLGLRYHWSQVGNSENIKNFRHELFDTLTDNLHIGLSPIASHTDMHWHYDHAHDGNGPIAFWCAGAKDEDGLFSRISTVLETARLQGLHVLLFPELVMTENLHTKISAWLLEHNSYEPVLRLIVAGTRHVQLASGRHSNRCLALDHCGDPVWEQEKRQPFHLPAEQSLKLLGIDAEAYEPSQLSQSFRVCRTALGRLATPICLDFLVDEKWKTLPVDVFFVPAMSMGLSRFADNSRIAGEQWGSAVFVCNAQPDPLAEDAKQAVYTYLPTKATNTPSQLSPYLFTLKIAIAMN